MTCGIYQITRKSTGQMYRGKSINIEVRWRNHCNSPNKTSRIDKTIQKYGVDEFELEILEILPQDDNILFEREIYWISKDNLYKDPFHYNLTPGGDGIGSGEDHPDINGEKNPRYLSNIKNEDIENMVNKGMSFKEISDIIGGSPSTIARRYKLINPNYEYNNEGENNPQYNSELKDEDILELYEKGLNQRQIAEALKVNQGTIHIRLKKYGIRTRKEIKDEDVINLHNQGLTRKEIAKKLGFSVGAIQKKCKQLKLPINILTNSNHPSYRHDIKDEDIENMVNKGMSFQEIGEKLSCSPHTISKRYKLLNPNYKPKIINNEDVINLHNQGLNSVEIAKQLNVTPQAIRNRSNKLGLTTKRIIIKDEDVINLHNQGLTRKEIANRLNCNPQTIGRRCKKLNLPINKKPKSSINKTQNHEPYIMTEEHKRKISEANKGEKNPNYGKHLSLETRKKISEANKGEKNHFYGKKHTKESKEKISKNHADVKGEKNPSYRSDISDEIILKLYNEGFTGTEIAKKLGCGKSTVYNRLSHLKHT